jgi:hypothetical protein
MYAFGGGGGVTPGRMLAYGGAPPYGTPQPAAGGESASAVWARFTDGGAGAAVASVSRAEAKELMDCKERLEQDVRVRAAAGRRQRDTHIHTQHHRAPPSRCTPDACGARRNACC